MHHETEFAYLLSPDGARKITIAEALSWQPSSAHDKQQLWLHLNYQTPECKHHLSRLGLTAGDIRVLLSISPRPRVQSTSSRLLICLRGINLNPGHDPQDMIAIRIYQDKHRLISCGQRQLASVKASINLLPELNPCEITPLLMTLCDQLTQRQTQYVDSLQDKLSQLEDLLSLNPNDSLHNDLNDLRRQALACRRYLAPQREALARLGNCDFPLAQTERNQLKDLNDSLVRMIEDLDLIRELVKVNQDELASIAAGKLNQRLYFLSIITSIFMPLGFLTGLLGVNIGGIPGTENHWAFAAFSGILGLLLIVQLWLIIHFKWLK
ncbi:CorA family divalent cation transporter [Shewanella sp. NIFS-20-20]|uniref:CorA family divalent cation transporter n=1 Tax=Shewanella sp. NIFS-20-20 TaxID=2853806 RepID=UPI001C43B809|nr:CorA family divalent cation transporter [Shewanella sp. NIFS-20-20]MBV7315828.1 zinc transporter ZntB [Shewanella sp. NIFS-20-20]